MAELEISQPTIGGVFSDRFYIIPAFQRLYEWEEKQTKDLFNDLLHHYREKCDNKGLDNYHLGSVICYAPENSNSDEIIDGQQRLTSLLIFLAAARDHFACCNTEFPDYAAKMLRATDDDENGDDIQKMRLSPHYPDGRQFMNTLVTSGAIAHDPTKGHSYRRLCDAYFNFRELIANNFDDLAEFKQFLRHLKNHVSLIFMRTRSYSACFRLFESINARGKNLEPTDLVKNILFTKAKDKDVDLLKEKWDGLMKLFQTKSSEFMTFFRDYALSTTSSAEMKDEQLIELFRNKKNSLEVIDDILEKATWYTHFLENRNFRNEKSEFLDRLSFLGNGSFRIHYNLLFAVADKWPHRFDDFLYHIERHVVVFKVLEKPIPALKETFSEWRAKLHAASSDEEVTSLLEAIFTSTKKHQNAFDTALRHNSVSYRSKVIRYLLTKIFYEVEEAGMGTPLISFSGLLRSTKAHQIEHVLPQTFDIEISGVSGVEEHEHNHWKDRLGNLLILESSLNQTIGKLPFKEKLEGYAGSSLVLNRFMNAPIIEGSNNALKRATSGFSVPQKWDKQAISDRSGSYVDHILQSFGFDDKVHHETKEPVQISLL